MPPTAALLILSAPGVTLSPRGCRVGDAVEVVWYEPLLSGPRDCRECGGGIGAVPPSTSPTPGVTLAPSPATAALPGPLLFLVLDLD